MAATKLSVYNECARLLGDARLATLTDDIEIRYALDDAWDGSVSFVLRQAAWRFALKLVAPAAGGTPILGFADSYTLPADWLRTQAIFVFKGPLECPIDCRQQGITISANLAAGVSLRYVSSDFADPGLANHPWPEHFARVVAAYLAFSVAARVTQSAAEETRLAQLFASLLPEAVAIDAEPESPWLRFQLDGRFQRGAQNVAQLEHWRYAMKTITISSPSADPPLAGYAFNFDVPADWCCTQAAYIAKDGREFPFDLKEHEDHWSTNIASFQVRYTSATRAYDAVLWPDLVTRAVLAYLEFEESGETIAAPSYAPPASKAGVSKAAIWQSALAAAKAQEAIDDSPWFQAQIDGSYLRALRAVATRGYWWFAVKSKNFELADADLLPGVSAYPYRFQIPTDWLKTHALFVDYGGTECPFDAKMQGDFISTATSSFVLRYVSTDVLDASLWPESFSQAVLARIELDESGEMEEEPAKSGQPAPSMTQAKAAMWQDALKAALEYGSLDENPWLRFQLDGRFLQGLRFVLEQGNWRFAVESRALALANDPDALSDGATSVNYGYRFAKPNDWLRTIWVYRTLSGVPNLATPSPGVSATYQDIDYRDEDGAIHCNFDVVYMRYLSSAKGLDSTQWPGTFRDALSAWLEHVEARADPKAAAVAAARFKFFRDQLLLAESNDNARDRPPQRGMSRIVQARFGRYGSVGQSYGNGFLPW